MVKEEGVEFSFANHLKKLIIIVLITILDTPSLQRYNKTPPASTGG